MSGRKDVVKHPSSVRNYFRWAAFFGVKLEVALQLDRVSVSTVTGPLVTQSKHRSQINCFSNSMEGPECGANPLIPWILPIINGCREGGYIMESNVLA
ncbi:hypothetical protein TNIN_6581 [Trichonephila inaurata madagascariensis]|uniref:Uncharacterized protein n=1 Tax=Trichonephila inaurata madagascariensis TaxID=2747483 RepID=A0A8X7C959_9ARAC|nr:hypothetical protein TNIN_6581 [Trichonephila inaurata madagascariensis]